MASRTDARFSTYSGAPSLQPSLAPTVSTRNTQTSQYQRSQPLRPHNPNSSNTSNMNEKSAMYSNSSPEALASTSTLASSTDPKTQDIKSWSKGFERMQDERLDKQRYVMSGNKSEEVSKLALGAKLERALGRRMTGQDASFTRPEAAAKKGEKALVEVS